MVSLYIHIPFCVKKCLYCDFLSFSCDSRAKIDEYIGALCRETELTETKNRIVGSIFIGGGTPTICDVNQIARIMSALRKQFIIDDNAELSIECNPGTANFEKLKALKEMGFNRLSIGLQSASDEELELLGRIHNYDEFLETYRMAREVGFRNINIDIMSALPGQTLDAYKNTLTNIVRLSPEHISAYSLIIEENTVFYSIFADDECVVNRVDDGILAKYKNISLPDEDEEREMYYLTERLLEQYGYHRYEISNYAKVGYECRHNRAYWTGGDYIGLGLGASSYVDGIRYKNIDNLDEYICRLSVEETKSVLSLDANDEGDSIRTDINPLTLRDKQEEFMITGLRLMSGVSSADFASRFGIDIMEVYGEQINSLIDEGLLLQSGDRIALSSKGIDVSNQVLCEFLFD